MGDSSVLMTQKTDFAKLADRYENFLVPTAHISIDGTRLRELEIPFNSLSLTLSLDGSTASYVMENVYDPGTRSFRKEALTAAKLGSPVSIELGYGSALYEIFYGYIHEAAFKVGENSSISITALDVRRLMQGRNAYLRNYAGKDCKAVVEALLADYKPLLKSLHVDNGLKDITAPPQKGSDLDYILEICKACDMEFLVFGSECWIRPMDQSKSVIMKLEGGRSLISFSRTMVYKDLVLRTRPIDEAAASQGKNQPQAIEVKVQGNPGYTYDLGIRQEKYIPPKRTDDSDGIRKRLEKEKNDLLQDAQGGSGECIGLPDLIPGRYIEITDMDQLMNGTYYLKSVTHNFGSDGFTTDFSVGGYGD